jgi:hypothetical protein
MVSIQREAYNESLGQEFLPLAQKCWDEGTALKGENCSYHGHRDIAIDPDYLLYRQLADAGRLLLFTIRDAGILVGYAVSYVFASPHHRKLLVANGDSIYVERGYRAYTPALIEMLLKELKSLGVTNMGWAVSQNGPVYELLCKLGFVADEIIMEKLICVSPQE